jgi:hypothetical protein
MNMNSKLIKIGFLGMLITLTACTSVPDDGGISPVQELVDASIGSDNPATRLQPENELSPEEVAAILKSSLDGEQAELL